MNIKKKLIAIGITALMALSSLTTVAEATRFDCKEDIGSFEWEVCYGQVKNQSGENRLIEVCISVYDDKTNELVGNYYSRAIDLTELRQLSEILIGHQRNIISSAGRQFTTVQAFTQEQHGTLV